VVSDALGRVQGRIKCVVWDLDDTLWDGVLLEHDAVTPRVEAVQAIKELDQRGILHSIASRNDEESAMLALRKFGLDEFFVYPRINWQPKSASLAQIARALNFDTEALAFVDDQEFERAEVQHSFPEVLCLDPTELAGALRQPEFVPRFVTDESRRRRQLYRSQIARDESERVFAGTSAEFLAQLHMRFVIRRASEDDLRRAEELTVRTNQLNSTGRPYSYEELDRLRTSPEHLLLVAELDDRFGSYGTIGLALVELGTPCWQLRLLLMSCRTMSRGVGTVLLNHIMRRAQEAGVRLRADFVETGRNRVMRVTYAFAGFVEAAREGAHLTLESDLRTVQAVAPYLSVVAEDA
jgi:FkbH-like protein